MANFNLDIGGACEKIIAQAKDYAKQNYPGPGGLARKNGTLDFLTDPQNGGVASELITTGNGKMRRARVFYKQRTKPCEILTGTTGLNATLCDNPEMSDVKETTVTINKRVATTPRQFTNERMVAICQDTESFVKEYLMSDQRALREQLDIQFLSLLALNVGRNYRQDGTLVTGGNYQDVALLKTDTNSQKIPLTGNYNDILMDYQNMEFSGAPYLIGQGNLQTFFSLAKWACCNASTPYGSAIADSGTAFMLDQAVNSTLAANRFLMIAPGIEHALFFNENTNINISTDIIKHVVIPDSEYPQIKYDLDFKWDECNKKWIYQQSVYYGLFNVIQADSFSVDSSSPSSCTDELNGVTGVWGFRATAS
jgi:hypothetical protein